MYNKILAAIDATPNERAVLNETRQLAPARRYTCSMWRSTNCCRTIR
jgi:hypothetical protein